MAISGRAGTVDTPTPTRFTVVGDDGISRDHGRPNDRGGSKFRRSNSDKPLAKFQNQRTRVANVMAALPPRAEIRNPDSTLTTAILAIDVDASQFYFLGPKIGKSTVGLVPKCYFQHDTWVTTLIDKESETAK